MMKRLAVVAILCAGAPAEIIDRVAASVDRQVITLSAIDERLRVAAFLNQTVADLGAESRRRMAERLIDQALVKQEMELSRYAQPKDEDVAQYVAAIERQWKVSTDEFKRRLADYHLDERILRENLRVQLATVRFIDLRFRPGSAVSDAEIEHYYQETFAPEWRASSPGKPAPEVEEVRDRLEQLLLAERANQELEQWLKQARETAQVRYFEEAFE
jgi:peptidyl-prolyl cis-trans isomerase SurA